MSKEDYEAHVKGQSQKESKRIKELAQKARNSLLAVATVAAMGIPGAANASENAGQDKDPETTTHTITVDNNKPSNDNNSIDFFGVAEVTQVHEDGTVYTAIGEELVDANDLNQRKNKREYKKDLKEAFENAEPDNVETVSLSEATAAGVFWLDDKNITMFRIDLSSSEEILNLKNKIDRLFPDKTPEERNTMFSRNIGYLQELNDTTSTVYKSVRTHEEQHRTNNKLGIYGPGLSPEQYAVLCQYDEYAASVAELNGYVSDYKKALKSGVSKEEALKVFDKDEDKTFEFYKEAIKNGLDPDSKEGKELMVQGTYNMWKDVRRNHPLYQKQIADVGKSSYNDTDFASMVIGNDKELQKRVTKMFDNICENDYCKENGIESPGNLSKYLPKETMDLLPNVRQEIADNIEEKTGLDASEREHIKESLDGKSDKAKQRNLILGLRGTKKLEDVSKTVPDVGPVKEKDNDNNKDNGIDVTSYAMQQSHQGR